MFEGLLAKASCIRHTRKRAAECPLPRQLNTPPFTRNSTVAPIFTHMGDGLRPRRNVDGGDEDEATVVNEGPTSSLARSLTVSRGKYVRHSLKILSSSGFGGDLIRPKIPSALMRAIQDKFVWVANWNWFVPSPSTSTHEVSLASRGNS